MAKKPSLLDRIIYGKGSEFAKVAFSSIRNARRTLDRVGKAIKESIHKKDGFSSFLDRLHKAFHSSANDAKRTARTESTRVENFARYEAGQKYYEETGKRVYKTWICTFQNSRDSHIALHNTRIPLEQDFQAFGGPMAYPGDSSRVGPEEICNCRCYMIVEEE